MTNFAFLFCVILFFNVGISFRSSDQWKKWTGQNNFSASEKSNEDETQKKAWNALIRKYLLVYLLATLSDWLQGPYVYALYQQYGYSQHDIAVLFVAGFGSSMVFGSFIGGMADVGGRRLFTVLFAVIYALSCMTKHFKNYWILMIGRLLGGIATSLLFSVFEAWLIRSHGDAKVKSFIGKSFSLAVYYNSIVAIVAGLVANYAAELFDLTEVSSSKGMYVGGKLAPFDLALLALVACGFFAATTWEENYGEVSETDQSRRGSADEKWYNTLKNAFTLTVRSTDILFCGLISSFFEGSMYIFVFMWTPELKGGTEDNLPFGLIFATFMVSCMAGSSLFSLLIEKHKCEVLAVGIFGVATFAMMMIAMFSNRTAKFLAMNLFEVTVGMYWPIMGTMKGNIVPEANRAAIYNLYRIPLNFIVLFSLLTHMTSKQSFALNAVMLTTATALQVKLMKQREKMVGSGVSSFDSMEPSNETVKLVDDIEAKV